MSERTPATGGLLRNGMARTLRIGTLVAVVLVGAGWAWSLVTSDAVLDERSVLELVGSGGPGTLIGAGLIGLTFLPIVVLGLAIVGFRATGERRLAAISAGVLALLVIGFATAAILGTLGG